MDDNRLQEIKARCEWGLKPETFNQSEDDHHFYREVLWLQAELEASQQQVAELHGIRKALIDISRVVSAKYGDYDGNAETPRAIEWIFVRLDELDKECPGWNQI